jgi:hypothetical protein
MWTPEGLARAIELLAEDLRGGYVIVRDGDNEPDEAQQAKAAIESVAVDGAQATVTASFSEGEANFDWRQRLVASASGVIVDFLEQDMGRKAPGAVWNVEAVLELAPEA